MFLGASGVLMIQKNWFLQKNQEEQPDVQPSSQNEKSVRGPHNLSKELQTTDSIYSYFTAI